jgi:hypothetical protein
MADLFERIAPSWAQSKITMTLSSGQSDRRNGGVCVIITQNENDGEKSRCRPPRPTRVPLRLHARSSRTELEKRSRVCFRLALASSLRCDRSTQNRSAHRLCFPPPTPDRSRFNRLKFVGKNIFQADFQLHQDGFQFVQSQVMLAMLDAKECLIGYANLLGKLCVRKTAPFLAEEFRQLPIQIALHT